MSVPNTGTSNAPPSRWLEFWRKLWSDRLFNWALFNVFLAIIPLFAPGGAALFNKKIHTHPLDLISHGELMLLCAPLVLTGLPELIKVKQPSKFTNFTLFAAWGIVFLSPILYTNATATSADNLDVGMVRWLSIVFYVCSAMVGGSCIVQSEGGVTP